MHRSTCRTRWVQFEITCYVHSYKEGTVRVMCAECYFDYVFCSSSMNSYGMVIVDV